MRDRRIVLGGLRLESGRELTFVKGTVTFGRDADLTIRTSADGRREPRSAENVRVLKISRSARRSARVRGTNAHARAGGLGRYG